MGDQQETSSDKRRRVKREYRNRKRKRLDDYNFDEVDYLKIDVEGHELKVLKGAIATIEKCNPVIVIEENAIFSLLDNTRDMFLTSTERNILASSILAVVVDTNFESYIKTNHITLRTYNDPEFNYYDSYINLTQGKDLSFYNPNDLQYIISYERIDNELKVTLIGIPFDNNYVHKINKTILELGCGNGLILKRLIKECTCETMKEMGLDPNDFAY